MSCDYRLLPHPGIQTLAPYIPGKSSEELAREQGLTDIIKMASNENPLGCSPRVLEALEKLTAHQLATYPVAAIHPLRAKIAQKIGVDTEMIMLSNGSDLLFTLCLICFALHHDKHALVHDYNFISFNIQAKTLGIPLRSVAMHPDWSVDIDALIAACHEQTAILFLSNPNNPVGKLIEYDSLERLLQTIPASTIVLLDEAYHEYIDKAARKNTIALLKHHPNLIITRTFSKAYGLAGLRLGYAIASIEITSLLHRVLLPFTVNQATLAAGMAALDDEAFIQETLRVNAQGLIQMTEGINNLGLTLLPTEGNFVTINCYQDASALYQALLRHGIIVRPLHPYGLNNYIRVSIGTKQQNTRFLDAMAICMNDKIKEVHHEK